VHHHPKLKRNSVDTAPMAFSGPVTAAFDSGAHFISTDYYRPDPKMGTNFQVTLPGGRPGRWNPLLQPPVKNLPPPE